MDRKRGAEGIRGIFSIHFVERGHLQRRDILRRAGVDFLTTYGANVDTDLEELWRRIVFSNCVSNTDNHLRNHGYCYEKKENAQLSVFSFFLSV